MATPGPPTTASSTSLNGTRPRTLWPFTTLRTRGSSFMYAHLISETLRAARAKLNAFLLSQRVLTNTVSLQGISLSPNNTHLAIWDHSLEVGVYLLAIYLRPADFVLASQFKLHILLPPLSEPLQTLPQAPTPAKLEGLGDDPEGDDWDDTGLGVRCVAWHPDGSRLAVGGWDGKVRPGVAHFLSERLLNPLHLHLVDSHTPRAELDRNRDDPTCATGSRWNGWSFRSHPSLQASPLTCYSPSLPTDRLERTLFMEQRVRGDGHRSVSVLLALLSPSVTCLSPSSFFCSPTLLPLVHLALRPLSLHPRHRPLPPP